MVEEIFNFLDADNDGIIKYADLHSFLVNIEYHNTEYIEISDMLSAKSSMRLYPESWFYICDILYDIKEFQSDFPNEAISEIEANKKHYQYSFINPLYQKDGWTVDHLTKVYLEYEFFDLKEHYSRLKNISNDVLRNERIYNLLADVSLNVCSHHLIVNHTLSTGEHLYCHILDPDQDPDQITWDKLEDILEKSATVANDKCLSSKEILRKAREKEEIIPQDVLFYDPDSNENNCEILDSLPEHSIFWHAIFEAQLPDIPEHIIQHYFDTLVKPCHAQFESNSELVVSDFERNLLIEEHVYREMEQHLQKWLWRRYATKCMYPAFAIQKWTQKNLLSHILPANSKKLMENAL